jgi:hypothetical protein
MFEMISKLLLWLLLSKCILAETECDWLRIVYEKMGGDARTIPQDCCQMDGVFCNSDGHIVNILWPSYGLTGFIPQEIGMLTNLEEM